MVTNLRRCDPSACPMGFTVVTGEEDISQASEAPSVEGVELSRSVFPSRGCGLP